MGGFKLGLTLVVTVFTYPNRLGLLGVGGVTTFGCECRRSYEEPLVHQPISTTHPVRDLPP